MARVEVIEANLKTDKNISAKNKKRVCAYARVSTDSEEQLVSYASQIQYYTEKIQSNPDWEFVGIYADEGISGTQAKRRPEFMRMINDAMNGKIDVIMVKSISRFARNTLHTLQYVRDLREHKVDVFFEKENIHTLELNSEVFLAVYSAFAQGESESTSENVRLGTKAKMKRGEPVGNPNCYGLFWNKKAKTYEIIEVEARVVRQIFYWYVDGIGTAIIAKWLNEMNIPSPRGKKWNHQEVGRIIRQEKYVGDLIGQKHYIADTLTHKIMKNYGEKEQYYVKDHHVAIIPREIWNKAQEIYERRSQSFLKGEPHTHGRCSKRYPFSSKIKCGYCGANYSRRTSNKRKNGEVVIYWGCAKKISDRSNCQHSKIVREELLENAFIQVYNSIILNKYKTKDLLFNAIKEVIKENNYTKKLDSLLKEEKELNKKMSNLIDMKLENYNNREAYEKKEDEISLRLKFIKKEINDYKVLVEEENTIEKRMKTIESHFNKPLTLQTFDKHVFDNIVEHIIIGEYGENGEYHSETIKFVLKTGTEYEIFPSTNSSGNESVSFGNKQGKY